MQYAWNQSEKFILAIVQINDDESIRIFDFTFFFVAFPWQSLAYAAGYKNEGVT